MKKFLFLVSFYVLVSCGVQDSSEDRDGISDADHRVFVTAMAFNGNMGGTTGADSYCMQAAAGANLERDYRAIIGDDTNSAESRLNITGAIYMYTNSATRELIAASGIDFWNTGLDFLKNSINKTEVYTTVNSNVWTGTTSEGGTTATQNCNEWQSSLSSVVGFYGDSSSTGESWVEGNVDDCDQFNHLYCISTN